MSATTTTVNPVISQLSAFAVPAPDRPALLPSPPVIPSVRPSLAHLLMASDDDLKRDYWHASEAYQDQPPKYYIDTVWKRHLDHHGYTRSFQRLQGTERERYQGIIDKEHRYEVAMIKKEDILRDRLFAAVKEIDRIRRGRQPSSQTPARPRVANPDPPAKRKRGRPRKYPRPEDIQEESAQPAPHDRQDRQETVEPPVAAAAQAQVSRQLAESARFVKAGIKELEGHQKETRQPLRHARQYPGFNEWVIDTHFGRIKATLDLHEDHWFMGHRPGDPIFRIVDAPRYHPIFGVEDLAHHPVFGREDFDLTQLYFRFRYEGIVPFNYPESQQRLQEHAFPAFLTIIIAALAFNPEEPDAELPPLLKRIWTILVQDMDEMNKDTKQELVYLMSALQRIWKIKYGTESSKLPRFLQTQFKTSKARLGEMAWLVCKVMSILPGYHVLRGFTEWFLQVMVGTNVQSMASWYFNNQLGPEAQEQMKDGGLDNILFYRSDLPVEEQLPVFQDIYDRHGSYEQIPALRLEELEGIARKFVPHLFVATVKQRTDPVARSSVALTPADFRRLLAGRRSNKAPIIVSGGEDESEDEEIIVASKPQPKKRKKWARPGSLPSPPTSSPSKLKSAAIPQKSTANKRSRSDPDEPHSSTPSKRARH